MLRLCVKALNPVRKDILDELDLDFKLTCGAVCVYPARVQDAAVHLKKMGSSLPVASGESEKDSLTRKFKMADAVTVF